jgi:hypothetical protein
MSDSPMRVGHDAYANRAVGCSIAFDENNTTTVLEDYAYCSVNDNYDQYIGEEIALRRVLKQLTDDEELIQDFWEVYYE